MFVFAGKNSVLFIWADVALGKARVPEKSLEKEFRFKS